MVRAADRDHVGRRIDTLMHCALNRRTLRLSCRVCPHVRRFDGVAIWWLFAQKGWSGLIGEVPRRFYCGRCWQQHHRRSRGPRLMITTEDPDKTPYPYPSEREWKRFVSRYRS